MRISTKKYLLYSSVFAIFTEAFFINYIIDWKLLYVIIAVNYFLLSRIKKLNINPWFLGLLIGVFIHGFICYTIIGIPYNYMLSQIMGIAIIATYYYNLIPVYTTEEIINVYGKMCVWIAALGYVLLAIYYNEPFYRLMSIFKEPAHYVIVVLPACYYFLKIKSYWNFAIIFGTLLLSTSSLGYIGCGLMFVLPNLTLKRVGYLIALVPVVFASFYFAYQELPFFKMRVDDTYKELNVIETGKFQEYTNQSSFAILSNLFITKENVKDHPFGSGIGSHYYMHTERYGFEMRPPPYLRTLNLHQTNAADANSLFLRLVSDFGIIGFVLICFTLYRSSVCFTTNQMYFAQGVFIYFLLKLFRDGHYFPPELFFFIWLFYYSFKEFNASRITQNGYRS